jgi:collagenase-like PrtC family protease
MNEFAALLYDKVNNLEQEGLKIPICSRNTSHFQDAEIMEKSDLEVELMMSSLYFFLC